MSVFEFFVPGKPQTAGSKTAVPMGSRYGVIEAGTKESRERKRTWRGDLRDGALRELAGRSITDLETLALAPISLTIVVVRKRPSGHVGTGRNAGTVKDWACGLLPVERPDTVKVVRAAEDALTGVVWRDDSQVVRHSLHKAFADQVGFPSSAEGLFVRVERAEIYTGPSLRVALKVAA